MAAQPLLSPAEAVAILNKPTGDSTVLSRTARRFDNINFRNGQLNAGGDFTQPGYPDAIFPYSSDPLAMPKGTDANFTLRLRGYFNVPAALSGKTVSFGVNCDDYCSLRIGTTDLMPAGNSLVSARVIKQVNFQGSGLYPIEMVYYQNGSTAYLEWARTDSEVPECPGDICQIPLTAQATYADQFKLVQKAELYSATVGENSGCQECGAPGVNCSSGSYCDNGLCQSCNLPEHCGAACVRCPQDAAVCNGGTCVQCVAECDCPGALICDVRNGKCISSAPCSRTDMCPAGMICNQDTSRCQNPPVPCTMDSMCPSCQTCDTAKLICRAVSRMCNSDPDCKDGYYCDAGDHLCKPRLKQHYVGGQAGCSMGQSYERGASRAATCMLASLALLGLSRRRRRQ